MAEKLLNKIQYLDANKNLVKRDFTINDSKIAALEAATQQATTELKGIVELATNDEAKAGTDTLRAVTPAALASVLAPINTKLENVISGVTNFAYKDYSVAANQAEMEVGIIYLVPFTADNQFIALDPATNAPINEAQEIAYYLHCIKDDSGKVTSSHKEYTQGFIENVAYTNKNNTFEQDQTFEGDITASTGMVSAFGLAAEDRLTVSNLFKVDITAQEGRVGGVEIGGESGFDLTVNYQSNIIVKTEAFDEDGVNLRDIKLDSENSKVSGQVADFISMETKGVEISDTLVADSKEVANAVQVKAFVESKATECLPISQASDNIEAGKIYLYYTE